MEDACVIAAVKWNYNVILICGYFADNIFKLLCTEARATTNVQKNKSYVGLFISYVGLFIST